LQRRHGHHSDVPPATRIGTLPWTECAIDEQAAAEVISMMSLQRASHCPHDLREGTTQQHDRAVVQA